MDSGQEGGLRLLTSDEISMAKKLFRNTISYNKVWIHHGSYLPFGLQTKTTSMSPNGEIYFRQYHRDDFSITTPFIQRIFIHELSHVWQREKGMNVFARGLFSWAADYEYTLDQRDLSEYPMEQQASIIADYFVLLEHDYYTLSGLYKNSDSNFTKNLPESVIYSKFRNTLKFFPYG